MSGDYKIKITTEADTADLKQTAQDLNKVTAAAGQTEAATKKLTVSKKGLKDVIQGLKQSIPEFGFLLNVLKSPITIVATLAAVAAAKFREFKAAVDDAAATDAAASAMARLQGSLFNLTEASRQSAIEFKENLAAIAENTSAAALKLKDYNDEIERKTDLENKQVERDLATALAGVTDPARKAQLESDADKRKGDIAYRRQLTKTVALENAGRLAKEEEERAIAALPAADRDVLAAQSRLADERRRQGPQSAIDAAARAKLEGRLKDVSGQILDPTDFLGGTLPPNDAALKRGQLGIEQGDILDQLQGLDTRADQREALVTGLEGDVGAAQRRRDRLRGRATKGAEEAQQFGRDAATGFADLASERSNDPDLRRQAAEQANAQNRYDAQRGAIRNRNVNDGGDAVAKAVEAAIKSLGGEIIRAIGDVKTDIRRQQSVD